MPLTIDDETLGSIIELTQLIAHTERLDSSKNAKEYAQRFSIIRDLREKHGDMDKLAEKIFLSIQKIHKEKESS